MDNNDLFRTIMEEDDFSAEIDLSGSIEYVPGENDLPLADGKTVLDEAPDDYDEQISYAGNSGFTFDVEGIDEESAETPLSNHLQAGMTLKEARYKIQKTVGAGGFGVVYRAFDNKLGIDVAIKELYPPSLVNRAPGEMKLIIYGKDNARQYAYLLDRFILEARSMAKFNSVENIVNIFDCFQENNTAYIVMEFIKGLTLEHYVIKHGGTLAPDVANGIIGGVLDGLTAIHGKGIIHRDIKPRNIFITSDNEVKIIDFGAARFSSTEEKVITRYSKVLTPGFAPPEQYRKDTKQGPYTDIYAVGAVYYYMLTGIIPEISVDRVVNDDIKPLTEMFPDISDYTARAIARSLELNSDLRIQSAAELKQGILGNKLIRTVKEEKKLRFRRRIIIIAATAAALCIAVLGIVYYRINYGGEISIDSLLDEDTAISICIPLETNESLANAQLTAWGSVAQGYESYVSENSKYTVSLELKYLSAATYDSSYESGDASTLFAPCEENEEAPKLSVINRLVSEETTLLYDSHYSTADSAIDYTVAFDPTVLYINEKLLTSVAPDKDAETIASIQDILSVDAEEDHTLLMVNTYDLEFYSDYAEEDANGIFTPLEQFCSGNVIFYIGHVSENYVISAAMPGYVVIANAPDIEGLRARAYEWRIDNGDSENENEINAAQLLLAYITGEDAQDQLFVQTGYMVPINPVAFERFIEYNPELAFIKENINNVVFT